MSKIYIGWELMKAIAAGEIKEGSKIKINEDRLSYIECALMTNLIEKLQKENEELKEENEYNKILLDMNNNFMIDKKTGNYKWNVIEIQKVKDKIKEEKMPLTIVGGIRNKKILEYGISLGRMQVLQELIEESGEK